MPDLPKPGKKEEKQESKYRDRVYTDENGKEHEWMYEGNPALWINGDQEDA